MSDTLKIETVVINKRLKLRGFISFEMIYENKFSYISPNKIINGPFKNKLIISGNNNRFITKVKVADFDSLMQILLVIEISML